MGWEAILLLVVGHALERRIGSVWFGVIYVLGALVASLTSWMIHQETIAVGAVDRTTWVRFDDILLRPAILRGER